MHQSGIPEEIRERIVARRGHFTLFDRLDAERTALLVIDMQRAFLDPGAPVETPAARGIVGNVNRLARAARAAAMPVVWVKMTAWEEADGSNSWPVFYEHFVTPEFGSLHRQALRAGAPLHAIADGLHVAEGDLTVEKTRFSAFIQGASDLDAVLKARGVDTIIVAGTLTNRCCESTARDAMMIGYKVVFVEDANAAASEEEHVAALINVAFAFGDVRRTEEVVALIEAAGSP